ncbi:ABC transporter substrate-binding protein [Paraburkholderia caribensis]|uniref:ABC transporter substrate-binding protein n=1 Tax=Paraburkholderia caribensis TaxID=75105 RepID=UPI0031DB3572
MPNYASVGRRSAAIFTGLAFTLSSMSGSAIAQSNDKYRLGIVTFLSGAAAGPFGVPAANAAKLLIDSINNGRLPAPYNTKGINGVAVEPVVIDEAGGATKQAEEYRNLVQRQNVNAVVGYISSGDCLAVGPLAEEMKVPTVLFDCGTSKIFETVKDPNFLFRTGLDSVEDNVAAARYIAETRPTIKSVGSIQQNYAFGQDSWSDFSLAIKQLMPSVKVVSEQWPKLGQGQYGAEISALSVANPDLIHSSLWGGDMEGMMLQASARGLVDKRAMLLTCGDTGVDRFKGQIPNGVIIGGRGPFGVFAPKSPLNDWFRAAYIAQYKEAPTYPAYKMAQAILGLKAAAEKAGKPGLPDATQLVKNFAGMKFEAPSGTVNMARSKGHQAVQSVAYGEYSYDQKTGKASVIKVKSYPGECLMPPDGTSSANWIKSGFAGAKCS